MQTTLLEPDLRLTVCGLDELDGHRAGRATHVLSILDPDYPEPRGVRRLRSASSADAAFPRHHRSLARLAGARARAHVEALVAFGAELDAAGAGRAAICWSTAMPASRARPRPWRRCWRGIRPLGDEAGIFARIREIRSIAWPNSRMIGFADDILGRGGRLNAACATTTACRRPASRSSSPSCAATAAVPRSPISRPIAMRRHRDE